MASGPARNSHAPPDQTRADSQVPLVGMRGLPEGAYTASVFDGRGRLVRRWEGYGDRATWDGLSDAGRVSAGMYSLRVEVQGRRFNAKILVTR